MLEDTGQRLLVHKTEGYGDVELYRMKLPVCALRRAAHHSLMLVCTEWALRRTAHHSLMLVCIEWALRRTAHHSLMLVCTKKALQPVLL